MQPRHPCTSPFRGVRRHLPPRLAREKKNSARQSHVPSHCHKTVPWILFSVNQFIIHMQKLTEIYTTLFPSPGTGSKQTHAKALHVVRTQHEDRRVCGVPFSPTQSLLQVPSKKEKRNESREIVIGTHFPTATRHRPRHSG